MEVSTGGIVMKSGNIGDVLEVKNQRSGKVVKGILTKNKKINIFSYHSKVMNFS